MPAKPLKRRNESLDMGSDLITISRDLLFVTLRRAVKQALVDGKTTGDKPDDVLHADAHGRTSEILADMFAKSKGKR